MPDVIPEKIRLLRQPRRGAPGDMPAQREHRIPHRHDMHRLAAHRLVQPAHLRLHRTQPALAERGAHRLQALHRRRIALLILESPLLLPVEPRPRRLHEHAQHRILLQPELREIINPLIRHQHVRREREHIHLPLAQRRLRHIPSLGQLPMLEHARAANHLLPRRLVRHARRLRHRRQQLRGENHETVRAHKHAHRPRLLRPPGKREAEQDGENRERTGEEVFHRQAGLVAHPRRWIKPPLQGAGRA